jgi:serine/threonine protein kinase
VLDIGATIGDYRLEERIGRGGMGVVFRATQLSLGRQVALKLVAPELAEDPEFRERFKREARLAAGIDHPNVVPVHQAEEQDGHLYIAMRYVPGTDLHALLSARGRLEPADAVRILEQVAAALDAAHEQGLVHRDVKPANVLLSGKPGKEHVYLTDFGVTKHIASGAGMTRTGAFVGTLDYVSPEQVQGAAVDGRADVYALGCVLYELLTGVVPFQRDSDAAKLFAHMSDPPPRPSERIALVDAALDAVVVQAMDKDPGERYPTAGEMAAAARAAVGPVAPSTVLSKPRVPPAAPPTSVTTLQGRPRPEQPTRVQAPAADPAPGSRAPDPVATSRGRSRRRRGVLLAACVGVAVALAIVVFVPGGVEEEPPDPSSTAPGQPELALLSPREIRASASSTLDPQPPNTYVAANSIDGDPTTAWAEGREGSAAGATITWTFDSPVDLRRVELINGYAKSDAVFLKNLRIRSADVTTASGRLTTTLKDTADVQMLRVPRGSTGFVRLRIGSVYGDPALEDCLLSEIDFFTAGR